MDQIFFYKEGLDNVKPAELSVEKESIYEVQYERDMHWNQFAFKFQKEIKSKIGLDIDGETLKNLNLSANMEQEPKYDDTILDLLADNASRESFVKLLKEARDRAERCGNEDPHGCDYAMYRHVNEVLKGLNRIIFKFKYDVLVRKTAAM